MDEKEYLARHGLLRSLLRWTGRICQWMVLALVLADVLVWSGVVHNRLIPIVAAQFTGFHVRFWHEGVRPLYLRNLRVQPVAAGPGTPTLFEVDALRLDWLPRFPAPHSPLLGGVHLWRPRIQADGTVPEASNVAFATGKPRVSAESGPTPAFLLPDTVHFYHAAASAAMPDWSAFVEGLAGSISLESLERFSARIEGDDVGAGWQGGPAEMPMPFPRGGAFVSLQREGALFQLHADVSLPGFLVVNGGATLEISDGLAFDVQIDRAQTDGPLFGELVSAVAPVRTGFESMRVSPAHVRGAWTREGLQFEESLLDARITGMRVGEAEAPWYTGELHIEADGDRDAGARFKVTLGQGQQFSGTVSGVGPTVDLEAQFENWSGQQVLALWPPFLDNWQKYLLNLRRLDGAVNCVIADGQASFSGRASPLFANDFSPRVVLDGAYAFSGNLAGTGEVTSDRGRAAVTYAWQPDKAVRVETTLKEMAAQPFLEILWQESAPDVDLVMSGDVNLEGFPDDGYRFNAALTADAFRYGAHELPADLKPLALSFEGSVGSGFSLLLLDRGAVRLGAETALQLERGSYDIARNQFAAQVSGTSAITPWGELMGYPELWGAMSLEGRLNVVPGQSAGFDTLALSLEPLGYEHHSAPYGQPVQVRVPVRMDFSEGTTVLGPLHAGLGDGTTLETGVLHLAGGAVTTSEAITLVTDFSPLVAKHYLAAASGSLRAVLEDFHYDGAGWPSGRLVYECIAPEMMLPDRFAELSGLSVSGMMELGPALSGRGIAALASLHVSGTHMDGIRGDIVAESTVLSVENIVFNLFDGQVAGRAEFDPFQPGLPLVFSGEVTDIDLGTFTEEFEPDSVVLTGKVDGVFSIGVKNGTLSVFDVSMEAREDFSMNRGTVEQLLMQHYMDDIAGRRSVERVIRSVIGPDEQRKFEYAQLQLELEDGRIGGYAKLIDSISRPDRSDLNVTMDIKIDPAAIMEALRLRQ